MRHAFAVLAAVLLATPILGAQSAPAPASPTAPAAPAYQHTHAEALVIGRAVSRHAFNFQLDSLMAVADSSAAPPPNLRELLQDGLSQMAMQVGPEKALRTERVVRVNGRTEYWRTAEFELIPVPLVFRVILGGEGRWRGFNLVPEEQLPAAEDVQP